MLPNNFACLSDGGVPSSSGSECNRHSDVRGVRLQHQIMTGWQRVLDKIENLLERMLRIVLQSDVVTGIPDDELLEIG